MDNTENEMINGLKKSLNDIYKDYRLRIDPESWKNAIHEAYEKYPDETSVCTAGFLLSHRYVPVKVWRTVCHEISLREQPVKLAAICSKADVRELLEGMFRQDPIRYAYIPSSCTEDEIELIINTASDALGYLDRGQIFQAEKALEMIRRFCPTHPDLLDMQKRFADVRSTGGVSEYTHENKKDELKEIRSLTALKEETGVSEAIPYLEEMIRNDFRCYEAYFPLGMLYLRNGDASKAEYIAEALLDLGQETADACILKGQLLEEKGSLEDAFFYYEEACRLDPSNNEAIEEYCRVYALLEPDYGKPDMPAADNSSSETKLADHEPSETIAMAAEADQLIKRGRLTEAYYELTKKAEEYTRSDLMRFKKALAMYLMHREPEAREVLKSVRKESPVYKNAQYLIEDIDMNISSGRNYDGILPPVLSDIFFSTGRYNDALAIYRNLTDGDMTADMWVKRARCEAETGKLNAALQSLANAINKDYRVGQARELAGIINQAIGENERALEMYDDALRLEPDNRNVCELKAAVLYTMKRYEELLQFRNDLEDRKMPACDADGYAGLIQLLEYPRNEEKGMHYLERAIKSGTSKAEFYIAAINACIEKSQYFRAMLLTEKGLENSDAADELSVKKCEILYLSKDLDAAYINAGMLLTRVPGSPEVQYLMGCIYSERGEEKEAIKWLRSAADLDTGNHRFAYAVADKCFEVGDMSGALTYYTRAIDIDESDHVSLKRRAVIYHLREEDEKAVEDIKKAMELMPEDPEIYLIIGDVLSEYEIEDDMDLEGSKPPEKEEDAEVTENDKEASDEGEDASSDTENALTKELQKDSEYYYTKALSIDPLYRQGFISRARFYIDSGRLEDAMRDIAAAMEIDDSDGDVFMIRGIIHHIKGENAAAIADFEKASETERFQLQAYSYIAKCRNALGEYEDAVAAADRGLEKDGDFLNLYVNRGVALYNLGKLHQAVEDFRRVIQKKNEVNTAAVEAAYRFRGMTNEKLGNDEDALNDYRMLLKYDPDHPDIRVKVNEIEEKLKAEERKSRFAFFRRKNRKV